MNTVTIVLTISSASLLRSGPWPAIGSRGGAVCPVINVIFIAVKLSVSLTSVTDGDGWGLEGTHVGRPAGGMPPGVHAP